MKKVGIKTWSGGTNYGTNLQAFALKRALECLGYEPVIVGVVCNNVNYFTHLDMFLRRIYKRIKWKLVAKKTSGFSERHNEYADQYAKQEAIFSGFCREEFPKLQVRSREQWKQVTKEYVAFITGSDQVWNPDFFEEEYMLDFVCEDNIRKISYASSVGVTSIAPKMRRKYKRLLKSYDAVSVRETSGVSVLQDISPVPVQVVLDPTMLLEKSEWDRFTKGANIKDTWGVNEEYILCYFVGGKETYWSYVSKIAEETGYKVIVIAMGDNTLRKDYEVLFDLGPKEFVWLIGHAAIVCTDSFHATVFSVLNHREFYVLKRFKDDERVSQNSRLYNLLESLGIGSRIIDDDQQKFIREQEIDYDYIDRILTEQRAESSRFLTEALK